MDFSKWESSRPIQFTVYKKKGMNTIKPIPDQKAVVLEPLTNPDQAAEFTVMPAVLSTTIDRDASSLHDAKDVLARTGGRRTPAKDEGCRRAGNVKIRRGPWNEDPFRVLEGLPDLAHHDEVDACSGALEMLNPNMKGRGAYELARRQAEQLRAEREATSGRAQAAWAPGSMEWLAEQKKSS
jgi:hypothetical protein